MDCMQRFTELVDVMFDTTSANRKKIMQVAQGYDRRRSLKRQSPIRLPVGVAYVRGGDVERAGSEPIDPEAVFPRHAAALGGSQPHLQRWSSMPSSELQQQRPPYIPANSDEQAESTTMQVPFPTTDEGHAAEVCSKQTKWSVLWVCLMHHT